MKDLSARITALNPEQRAVFEAALKAKGLRTPAGGPDPAPAARRHKPVSDLDRSGTTVVYRTTATR